MGQSQVREAGLYHYNRFLRERQTEMKTVKLPELPPCDICAGRVIGIEKTPEELARATRAVYDGPTKYGPWGYMCQRHMKSIGYPSSPHNRKLEVAEPSKPAVPGMTIGDVLDSKE